ncbi:microtub_bind domain-containing protein [Caerostris extrusa]|uniref:Microtub_bind domain-containing protein n=1 Tax=Caerostris extrusa TaxID=172846 RepID=A0AAV4MC51_CAEEX|nr:microtub_bind domain-containing protein [Caerostris extrusa]
MLKKKGKIKLKVALDLAKNLAELNNYLKLEDEADQDLVQFGEFKQTFNNVVDSIRPVKRKHYHPLEIRYTLGTINILEREKEQYDSSKFNEIIDSIDWDEISIKKESTSKKHKTVSSEIAQIWKSSSKNQIENYEELQTEFESHDTVLVKELQKNQQEINIISTAVSEKIDSAKHCLTECQESLKNSSAEMANQISEFEKRRIQTTSHLKEEIFNTDLMLEKFISEDLVKDISTGKTPQRKTLTYPQELVATSPLDRVLRRFRLQREKDTDLAVHLPLENSFNSDISIESGKNKENYRKKTSRLPKKLPKFKGFAKPTLPMRKPLISANSHMDSSTV